jgi:uncharacterized RDD family membrane protein YckC
VQAEKMPTGMTPAETAALLAGWWRRFGGYVIDLIIVGVADRIVVTIIERIDVALRAPLSPGLYPPTPGAQVALVVANVGILVGYSFVLLRFGGQTVGMMATGVRAVDRSSGAALNTQQTWRRVLAFFLIVTLWEQIAFVINTNHLTGPTPIAASIFIAIAGVGVLTTGLWAAGSPLNQTLQDKAADTIVIRARGTGLVEPPIPAAPDVAGPPEWIPNPRDSRFIVYWDGTRFTEQRLASEPQGPS